MHKRIFPFPCTHHLSVSRFGVVANLVLDFLLPVLETTLLIKSNITESISSFVPFPGSPHHGHLYVRPTFQATPMHALMMM